MERDGAPVFTVCGEAHFCRITRDRWEDTLIKAKMGGIDVIATYVLWIVHEEVEGEFRFDGNRDLRAFLTLCAKHGLEVILRIGPFAHGEVRNGGLPDWLYGKPYEVREPNEGFYAAVRRYFAAVHRETDGLYFSQGGPVIAVQLDNEFMHSAAPWERTTGVSNEWVSAGRGGEQYLRDLKRILQEVGMVTPFYTCTAWGGAMVPVDEALPLWGDYSYWPWIFYEPREEGHPATPEYLYRDLHNNDKPRAYNFEPRYAPESRPYACCEMMGGMFCSYNYRFTLPYESVDALANIKLGSGCNLLGYYMYRGGTNPRGTRTPYLNEGQTPKLSYDYQAAIGEFGQLRDSYYRLRTLHQLCHSFAPLLCASKTVLPDGADEIQPTDSDRLRCCVRVHDSRGFVFLNNFQDHHTLPDRRDERLRLRLPAGDLVMEGLSLAAGENAVLPFGWELDGQHLRYATAQPIARLTANGTPLWLFFAPAGMEPVYHFAAAQVQAVTGCAHERGTETVRCKPRADGSAFTLTGAQGSVSIVTLSRADSSRLLLLDMGGGTAAFLSDAALLWDGETLRAETERDEVTVCAWPPQALAALHTDAQVTARRPAAQGIFAGETLTLAPALTAPHPLTPVQVGPSRYVLDIPPELLTGHKTVLLRVRYTGDIGSAFIDGELIGDHFCNGGVWELRLDDHAAALRDHPLTLYLTPLREGANVRVDSPMAARSEDAAHAHAALHEVWLQPVQEITLLPPAP